MQWLDDLTYGIQAHEMMIVEAFLGIGKSSWCIKMCADAYFLRDQTPLFFSFRDGGSEARRAVDLDVRAVRVQRTQATQARRR